MKNIFRAAILSVLTACVTPAYAGPDRVSILLGSHHTDAKMDFNESNPGIFFTWENPKVHWTAGVYHNSFGRVSVIGTAAVPVIRWDEGELSVFAGAALYPKDAKTFAVHLGDVVPVGGLQVRHQNYFMQVSPSDGYTATAVVSLGLTFEIP